LAKDNTTHTKGHVTGLFVG